MIYAKVYVANLMMVLGCVENGCLTNSWLVTAECHDSGSADGGAVRVENFDAPSLGLSNVTASPQVEVGITVSDGRTAAVRGSIVKVEDGR